MFFFFLQLLVVEGNSCAIEAAWTMLKILRLAGEDFLM